MQFTNPLHRTQQQPQQPQQQQQQPHIIIIEYNRTPIFSHKICIQICAFITIICIAIGASYFLNGNSFRDWDMAVYIVITAGGGLYLIGLCFYYCCRSAATENQSHLEDTSGNNRV
jgi:hypothetical protein